jgi:hypothetical protein
LSFINQTHHFGKSVAGKVVELKQRRIKRERITTIFPYLVNCILHTMAETTTIASDDWEIPAISPRIFKSTSRVKEMR